VKWHREPFSRPLPWSRGSARRDHLCCSPAAALLLRSSPHSWGWGKLVAWEGNPQLLGKSGNDAVRFQQWNEVGCRLQAHDGWLSGGYWGSSSSSARREMWGVGGSEHGRTALGVCIRWTCSRETIRDERPLVAGIKITFQVRFLKKKSTSNYVSTSHPQMQEGKLVGQRTCLKHSQMPLRPGKRGCKRLRS